MSMCQEVGVRKYNPVGLYVLAASLGLVENTYADEVLIYKKQTKKKSADSGKRTSLKSVKHPNR